MITHTFNATDASIAARESANFSEDINGTVVSLAPWISKKEGNLKTESSIKNVT